MAKSQRKSKGSKARAGGAKTRDATRAKQAATRERRVAQAIEWMAEGKKRHWKYEKC